MYDLIPAHYFEARERFRELTRQLGWALEAHPIEARGPGGEELTADVALSSDAPAGSTLVVSSGLHGVEGFFGSAAQCRLLETWAGESPGGMKSPSVRCVFLHALNPYGFAWSRRFDEGNIDPNRNFLLPDESYEGSPPLYAELDPFLNPKRPPSREAFRLHALWYIARYGMRALQRAIAGGQYDYPQGLFYGGRGPGSAHRLLDRELARWVAGSASVVHIDFHTGLGPRGRWKLLLDDPPTESQHRRLVAWFGPDCYAAGTGDDRAYQARGGLGRWCQRRGLVTDYLYACAEFGTYDPVSVLAGLRAENRAHHWGDPGNPGTVRAKTRLRELFCPASDEWRTQVLGEAADLVTRAIGGMSVS